MKRINMNINCKLIDTLKHYNYIMNNDVAVSSLSFMATDDEATNIQQFKYDDSAILKSRDQVIDAGLMGSYLNLNCPLNIDNFDLDEKCDFTFINDDDDIIASSNEKCEYECDGKSFYTSDENDFNKEDFYYLSDVTLYGRRYFKDRKPVLLDGYCNLNAKYQLKVEVDMSIIKIGNGYMPYRCLYRLFHSDHLYTIYGELVTNNFRGKSISNRVYRVYSKTNGTLDANIIRKIPMLCNEYISKNIVVHRACKNLKSSYISIHIDDENASYIVPNKFDEFFGRYCLILDVFDK